MNDQRMIGHYRVIELLGTGAMGTVHIALDTFIERPVAIKSLRPELTQDPEFVSRFRAEAKSLARLNHPNIATLYSSLLDGSDLYMVMELVRGRPLDDVLRDRGKPLSVKQSLAIIAQAADGLSYAHEMGVIHRDIKPSNLMIGNDGRVKIMDFGIARVRGSARLTRAGTAVGTPLYMSPEQCRGGEGDERSDLYSLAIVLYEMLGGAPPFSGATEYDLIQAQIGAAPPPLVPRAIGVTPELESAIMTALAKKPEQRFPSVRAFSDAIGATAMRPDATTVVRNATHLIEAPQNEAEDNKSPTRALDIAKSRIGALARSFKALHPAVQGASAVAAAAVLAAPIYFASTPSKPPGGSGLASNVTATSPGLDGDAGKLNAGSGEHESKARAKTRAEVGDAETTTQEQKYAQSEGSPGQENRQSRKRAETANGRGRKFGHVRETQRTPRRHQGRRQQQNQSVRFRLCRQWREGATVAAGAKSRRGWRRGGAVRAGNAVVGDARAMSILKAPWRLSARPPTKIIPTRRPTLVWSTRKREC
jgi:serine/threonine protein kinase